MAGRGVASTLVIHDGSSQHRADYGAPGSRARVQFETSTLLLDFHEKEYALHAFCPQATRKHGIARVRLHGLA
jgi:hypothetical protein